MTIPLPLLSIAAITLMALGYIIGQALVKSKYASEVRSLHRLLAHSGQICNRLNLEILDLKNTENDF